MAILTELKAKNIKPTDKPIPHGGVTGLSLHPSTHKGKGKWVLRYVSPVTSTRRKAGLGAYPETSIAEAAKKAIVMREIIAKGGDPLEEKSEQKRLSKIPTFEQAAIKLHADLSPGWKNQKHAQQWINTLTQYIFPSLGTLSLDRIQPIHIADALRPIWLDKPETASRVKQRIHAVMAYGWANQFCNSNPCDVVGMLLPQQPSKAVRTQHQPAMDWRDIPLFVLTTLHKAKPYDVTPKILEFLILTASRSGEVRSMTWNEVDFENKIWSIPAIRMKTKLAHRIPLSDRAISILLHQKNLQLHDQLVFPSINKKTILSDMTITSYLRRHKVKSTTEGRYTTAHGFRSSFRDWCSENGYPRDLAERALAHTVQNQVEAAYHRTDLLENRRPMMIAWSKFVTAEV